MSKRKSKLSSLIIAVVALLVLAFVVGVIVKFTRIGDDLTDLFDTSFRVEYNGVNYKGENNEIYLKNNEQARFEVKSVNGYSVVVKPNVTSQTDFTYTVDGVSYKYSETNLTKAFCTQDNFQSGYFKLNAFENYSLESVLSKLYEGKTVVVYGGVSDPYLLSVISGDITISFVLHFDTPNNDTPGTVVPGKDVKDVTLSGNIVF